jgi:hypothetical protein
MGDWADQFPHDSWDDAHDDEYPDEEWGPNPGGYGDDDDTAAWLLYPDEMAQAEEGTSDDDAFGFLTRGYRRPHITNASQRPGRLASPRQPSPRGREGV